MKVRHQTNRPSAINAPQYNKCARVINTQLSGVRGLTSDDACRHCARASACASWRLLPSAKQINRVSGYSTGIPCGRITTPHQPLQHRALLSSSCISITNELSSAFRGPWSCGHEAQREERPLGSCGRSCRPGGWRRGGGYSLPVSRFLRQPSCGVIW